MHYRKLIDDDTFVKERGKLKATVIKLRNEVLGFGVPIIYFMGYISARPMGFEPTVYPVTGDHFNQLNYGRISTNLSKTDFFLPRKSL